MQITKTTVEYAASASENRVRGLRRDQVKEPGRRKYHQLGTCKAGRSDVADAEVLLENISVSR